MFYVLYFIIINYFLTTSLAQVVVHNTPTLTPSSPINPKARQAGMITGSIFGSFVLIGFLYICFRSCCPLECLKPRPGPPPNPWFSTPGVLMDSEQLARRRSAEEYWREDHLRRMKWEREHPTPVDPWTVGRGDE